MDKEPQHPAAPNINVFEKAAPCFICAQAINVPPAALAVEGRYGEAKDQGYAIVFAHRECIRPHVHPQALADFDATG